MPSPVTGDDFKAILPAPNSNLCAKILAWFSGLELLYKWFAWAFNADGTATDAFKHTIGVAVGTLTAPVNVLASDGTFTDHVIVNWDPVDGATFYEVWRGPAADNSAAALLATVTSPTVTYSDASVTVDQKYFYFVKAKTATDSSGFSAGDSGFADSSGDHGAGSTGTLAFTGSGTWLVPAGVTVLQFEGWGAGGGGGSGYKGGLCPADSQFIGGGGGGSGEYVKVTGLTVTPGETLTITVPAGGPGGAPSSGSDSGGSPSPTSISRGSTTLVATFAGTGGQGGSCNLSAGGAGLKGSGATHSGGTLATDTNGTDGNPGNVGSYVPSVPITGGTGGAATNGHGAGGNGGTQLANGSKGGDGYAFLTW